MRQFRQQVYPLLGPRKDVLFELMDAVIQTPHARSFAELSLAPACTRQWPSIYKALDAPVGQPTVADITVEPADPSPMQAVHIFCAEQLPTDGVAQFAIDVSGVRRMRSPTLKDRLYYHGAAREVPGTGVVVGLPYSFAAWVPERGGSFAPPVHIHRLEPGETAVEAAVAQVRWLAFYLPPELEWRAGLDGAYGNRKFLTPLQDKAVQVVARTRDDRVLYRRADPEAYGGHGRKAVFGDEFRFRDPSTWGPPDQVDCFTDPAHGQVELELWRDLGMRGNGSFVTSDVIRSRIHTEREKPPKARWYQAWNGKPEQAVSLREWYETSAHRWGIEPANRFRKERLYAELPKVQTAARSDHWLLQVQLIEWMLYLAARAVAAAQKVLPWQKPQPADKITPNRVIESLASHLSEVGTPAQPVLPRGKAPGWPAGKPRTAPEKYKLTPKSRKK
ncbi:MAG: hypothetical protein ACREVW_16130, partial [Burkholderiales bacterium]